MANNLAAVAPKLLAAGVKAIRERAIMPRLVNRSYENIAAQKGSVIDIPIGSAVTSTPVAPAITPPANADSAPTKAQITMDFWEEGAFYLTDKEIGEVMEGVVPLQASEAVRAVVNSLDRYLHTKAYQAAFNVGGTAGTTPFASDTAAYKAARKFLNKEGALDLDRRVMLDPDAEANASSLALFTQADQRGDQGGIIDGQIGKKLGAEWYWSQNVRTHTAGVPGGSPTATGVAGAFTATIAAGGAAGTYLKGDIVSFAGHNQTYTVTSDLTLNGSGAGTLNVYPALRATVTAGSAVTLRASHVANLLFHRDAIAFASRPLGGNSEGLGVIERTAIDDVSGLVLRLEITRQHKQNRFAYDILGGATVVRPEFLARILG